MRHSLVCCLLLLTLSLGACAPLTGQAEDRLPVVATFSIVADLVQNVGREHIALTTLAGAGVDPHTFTPAPQDAAALAQARLVFENGAGFEGWLDELLASSNSRAVRVTLTEAVALHAAGGDKGHGAHDPHVWHDVNNALAMVAAIRDALIDADPAHRADYEANAQAYSIQLAGLDQWIVEQVDAIPPERRKLVTTHDTFGYFAERYGFEVLGSVLPSSTEGASPSAQELAALVEAVRAAGVPAVFAENISPNSLINQVAQEAGVQVVASLYTDALGPEGSGAETYIDLLRQNTATLVAALGS